MTRNFKIGGFPLAADVPPLFFAEIGSYFNGDVDLARRMIEQVIAARTAVPHQPLVLKTEILDDPEICLRTELLETYAAKDGRVRQENYRALIERKIVPLGKYAALFKLATDAGMPLVASVYDFTAADFAAAHGAAALKIASSNVVHVPLIRHVAKSGLPVVIDTGRTTLAEVQRAVATARAAGCQDIVVQHSPDGHPALPKAHNLRILQTYMREFGLPVGLSDHYVGIEMLYMAIAFGATVLEKGVHVDPEEFDQDISHSMGIDRLPEVLRATYACWQAMGKPLRDTSDRIEGVIGSSQRQCLVAKKDLKPGDALSLGNVRFAFPCRGIPVERWDAADGARMRRAVGSGAPIQWNDVERKPD